MSVEQVVSQYHLVRDTQHLHLPDEYLSNKLNRSKWTIRNWKDDKSKPRGLEQKLEKDEQQEFNYELRKDFTLKNIYYHLAKELYSRVRKGRKPGAKTISNIFSEFYQVEIPVGTLNSWLIGDRKPLYAKLKDENIISKKMEELETLLTKKYLDYHLAIALDRQGWPLTAISSSLRIDYEKVRGWARKGCGNTLAKAFEDENIINEKLSEIFMHERKLLGYIFEKEPGILSRNSIKAVAQVNSYKLRKLISNLMNLKVLRREENMGGENNPIYRISTIKVRKVYKNGL